MTRKLVVMVCELCGKRFETKPRKGKRFCSRACTAKWNFHRAGGAAKSVRTRKECAQERQARLSEWFWENVNKEDGCWLWNGDRKNGYGRVSVGGQQLYAHRVSWQLTNGQIPNGMFICHHCDTPLCVRPDHLFLGTPADNVRDMRQKGRYPTDVVRPSGDDHWARIYPDKVKRGEANNKAKLTEGEVIEIRSRYATGLVSQQNLAVTFGVSQPVISSIVTGRTWKHTGVKCDI